MRFKNSEGSNSSAKASQASDVSWVTTRVLRTIPPDTTDELCPSLDFLGGINEDVWAPSLFLSPNSQKYSWFVNTQSHLIIVFIVCGLFFGKV